MKPLAERLRPTTLSNYIGQTHLVGEGAVLRRMIEGRRISSFILWGPPGVGKTTLAKIVAATLDAPFYTLSAVTSGVKEVREVISQAKNQQFFGTANPILFIDEIHRFSKSQQDSLLAAVETGEITLIGATTENPSFEVIRPLLSRCQVYVLQPLNETELLQLVDHAIHHDILLRERKFELKETEALVRFSGGDARKLLNILELLVNATAEDATIVIDNATVTNRLQENPMAYDKEGEMHYDIISAFIKSIRGSDPDAAIYWLARMIAGGEDPKFIARRLVISASEDIGLANPNALLIANAAFDAVNKIGWPEGRIPLAEATIYLPQVQFCLQCDQCGSRLCRTVGQPSCAAPSAQCTNFAHEVAQLWHRLPVSPRFSAAFCGTTVYARNHPRDTILAACRQLCRRTPRSLALSAVESLQIMSLKIARRWFLRAKISSL